MKGCTAYVWERLIWTVHENNPGCGEKVLHIYLLLKTKIEFASWCFFLLALKT
jgi:hypothetical protein